MCKDVRCVQIYVQRELFVRNSEWLRFAESKVDGKLCNIVDYAKNVHRRKIKLNDRQPEYIDRAKMIKSE